MATGKRYYWIKLKESFMNSDTVDYLMSQPNGANYVVLYQMLCLKTINTEGRLSRRIGEVIIPYDVEKIQRDCKWFSADTIRVALKLYHSFGLIYEDVDGTLVLADHGNLVGSETDWAEKRRRQRVDSGDAPALPGGDNVPTNVPQSVPTDIRDKETRDKEFRDKSLDTRGKKKKADAFSDFAGEDDDLLTALRDFEKMRKSIGKPLTDRAKTMLLNKLQSFPSADWIAILEQSIFHSWQGIFPLHDAQSESEKTSAGDPAMDELRRLHAMFQEEEQQ